MGQGETVGDSRARPSKWWLSKAGRERGELAGRPRGLSSSRSQNETAQSRARPLPSSHANRTRARGVTEATKGSYVDPDRCVQLRTAVAAAVAAWKSTSVPQWPPLARARALVATSTRRPRSVHLPNCYETR